MRQTTKKVGDVIYIGIDKTAILTAIGSDGSDVRYYYRCETYKRKYEGVRNFIYEDESIRLENTRPSLIANAPEMLDALKMVKDAWENNEVNFECNESNGTGYVGTHHLIKKALDAIAKAEGSAS